jgi:hypothetical protein
MAAPPSLFREAGWQLVNQVQGQRIGTAQLTTRLTTQKTQALNYIAAEALNPSSRCQFTLQLATYEHTHTHTHTHTPAT